MASKPLGSLRYSRLRSCFVPLLFLFQVVSNNTRTKIKINRANSITWFPEGTTWHLESQNGILLEADWKCSFGGQVVPDRHPSSAPVPGAQLSHHWCVHKISSRFTLQCQGLVLWKKEMSLVGKSKAWICKQL